MAFLDDAGLVKLWQHIQARLSNKIDKESGKSLIADTEIERLSTVITGLEVSDNTENLEGVNIIQNAHTLGGITADQYVLKSELGNIAGSITNINGIGPDENGSVTLTADDIGALMVNLEEGSSNIENYALKSEVVTSIDGETGAISLINTIAWEEGVNIVKGFNLVTGIPFSMELNSKETGLITLNGSFTINYCQAFVKNDYSNFTATVAQKDNSNLIIVIKNNDSSPAIGSGTINLFIIANSAGQLYTPN